MNPIDSNAPFSKDHRMDLLVDGELSEAERRELLATLDDEPGGWRQCALVFLEGQAFKQDIGSMVREPVERPAVDRPTPRSRQGAHRRTLLAVAASFLVALFTGTQLSKLWQGPDSMGSPPVELVDKTVELVDKTLDSRPLVPTPNPQADEMLVKSRQPSPPVPTWVAEFAGPNEGMEPIRVPAVERDRIDEEWVNSLPDAIPPDVARQWERIGHPIRQHRRLVPFRLNDGRQLVVPVDEVDIHYVGRPAL